ncbi:MAG: 30S ribosome-binding factor RbfA [Deltaproteobacteria bacterium]|jgi:ribosome-binding factor A|nr:30S ribosome-binding factor RbfA [Deltaproteobacteria bacterium]MCK5009235.1 30S ribosome-binding factor RbfA [Deltaproteobacteria bacterium]MCK5515149.1 30S ribosome-binding factor RbfA [Deltaproteobacteria bacterium]NOQ85606.1 30S ribosome-binding factor RbfA [Deltaproteobacteria bacterium]
MNHNYKRADRVSDLLKVEISQMLLKEVKDPHIGFMTITGVEVSKDLHVANVFYTILGDEKQVSESAQALSRVSHFIKRQLGKRLRMRYIPDIIFRYDHSLEYGAKIDNILGHLKDSEETDPGGK